MNLLANLLTRLSSVNRKPLHEPVDLMSADEIFLASCSNSLVKFVDPTSQSQQFLILSHALPSPRSRYNFRLTPCNYVSSSSIMDFPLRFFPSSNIQNIVIYSSASNYFAVSTTKFGMTIVLEVEKCFDDFFLARQFSQR